jgi:N-acetylglucosaminyl-diphospho-decaprenol L-rhamnosyltransferase
MKTLSIGILLYQNSTQEVEQCLNALANQENKDLIGEVLIRDQGGDECSTVIKWQQQHPGELPLVLSTGENVGFGAGHNYLFAQKSSATSAYVCLNPDGVLHPQCLSRLHTHADAYSWRGLFEAMQEPCMPPKYFDPMTGKTEWCMGACLLIPDSVYQDLQGFDERFFMYCEDVDLSWRARAMDLDCFVCSDALFYHYVDHRSARNLMNLRSRLYLAYKWGAEHYAHFIASNLGGILQESQDQVLKTVEDAPKCSDAMIAKVHPNFEIDGLFARQLWK